MIRDLLRVGNCSGFWGDRRAAARELLEATELDVLTGDWLAELTMQLLEKQRSRDPLRGFATSFVDVLEEVLGTCLERRIRIVANAGGVNPEGCAEAIRSLSERLGLAPRIGTVTGDDVTDRAKELVAAGALRDAETGEPLDLTTRPLLAAHAYLGGWGIAACLEAGANVVVTGRTTDAALVVGPAAWAFGWTPDDHDALAGAVVAGHVIECGGQATGGNYAFFQELPPQPVRLGFPVAELRPDGSSVITKPARTGGAVTVETVTAQLLYEVAGPGYLNADVTARLDSFRLTQDGPDRVLIEGVRGEPPPTSLKVSSVFEGGWRNAMTLVLTGCDAEAKAAMAEATLWDLVPGGRDAFDSVDVELLGRAAEDPETLGAAISMLRIAVAGHDQDLVGRAFSSAVIETGLCSYPGFFATTPPSRATAYSVYRPGLVEAAEVVEDARVDGVLLDLPEVRRTTVPPALVDAAPVQFPAGPTARRALGELCGARSGDKGGTANVGVWVRNPAAYGWLESYLDIARLRSLLPGAEELRIDRFALPNLHAVNFVVHGWLGHGVSSSLRLDAQAKGLAEYLRARHVDVPAHLVA